MGAALERPEFDIKSPLGVSLLIFPQGYLLKFFFFHEGIFLQDSMVFSLLGVLPAVVEPYLPIFLKIASGKTGKLVQTLKL